MIVNFFNAEVIKRMNKKLGINLPTERKHYITVFEPMQELANVPIKHRFQRLLELFPDEHVLFIYNRNKTEDPENDNLFVFPGEWKLIPKMLNNRPTQVALFGNEQDYYIREQGGKAYRHCTKGLAKIFSEIHNQVTETQIVRELRQLVERQWPKEAKSIMRDIHASFSNEEFKNKLDIIINGIEAETNLIYNMIHRPSERDFYYFKMLYALWFKVLDDRSIYIREFEGHETDIENDSPYEYVDKFIGACKAVLGISLNRDDIYTDVEKEIMEESFIESAAGGRT